MSSSLSLFPIIICFVSTNFSSGIDCICMSLVVNSTEQGCNDIAAIVCVLEPSNISADPSLFCCCNPKHALNQVLSSTYWVFIHSLAFAVLKVKTHGISNPP